MKGKTMASMIDLAFESFETVTAPVKSGRGRQPRRWEVALESLKEHQGQTVRLTPSVIAQIAEQDEMFKGLVVESHGYDKDAAEAKKNIQSLTQQIKSRLKSNDVDSDWYVVSGVSPSDSNLYGIFVGYRGPKTVAETETTETEVNATEANATATAA